MAEKMYAIVGNWDFQKQDGKGISSYSYDPETAEMKLIMTVRDDVAVGNTFADSETGIVYATYEQRNLRGRSGGGGYVLAFKLDKATGGLTEISDVLSLACLPSYIWIDKSGKYALVSNHATSNVTTKIVKNEDGTFTNRTETDDGALVLFRLNDDGSLGDVCDAYIVPSADKITPHPTNPRLFAGIPHLHSVVGSPNGEIFVACDKGLDKVHVFGLDRESGRLIYKSAFDTAEWSAPRYSVFHPTKPILYENNENETYIHTFNYNKDTGELALLATTDLLEEHGAKGMPSDITVDSEGKFLYAATRGANKITVYALGDDGLPTLLQIIDCGGDGPRGIKLSPDGRFFFSANLGSKSVAVFRVNEDGTLTDTENRVEANCPGNITFVC